MKRNKKPTLLGKVKHILVSVLILALFCLPVVVTTLWVKDVVFNSDPRKTFNVVKQEPNYSSLDLFGEPLISITFDDGWESIYSNGLPILQDYNIRTTQFILGDLFYHTSYMSEDQVRSFLDAGHDIGSHTMTHDDLVKLDEEDLLWQIEESKKILSEKFGTVGDFASPLSSVDDRVLEQIRQNYRSHRNTFSDVEEVDQYDVNVDGNFDVYNIYAYTVNRDTTVEDLSRLVGYARANNGWVVLCYHQIDYKNTYYSVSPDAFRKQMDFVANLGIKSPTLREVIDNYYESEAN